MVKNAREAEIQEEQQQPTSAEQFTQTDIPWSPPQQSKRNKYRSEVETESDQYTRPDTDKSVNMSNSYDYQGREQNSLHRNTKGRNSPRGKRTDVKQESDFNNENVDTHRSHYKSDHVTDARREMRDDYGESEDPENGSSTHNNLASKSTTSIATQTDDDMDETEPYDSEQDTHGESEAYSSERHRRHIVDVNPNKQKIKDIKKNAQSKLKPTGKRQQRQRKRMDRNRVPSEHSSDYNNYTSENEDHERPRPGTDDNESQRTKSDENYETDGGQFNGHNTDRTKSRKENMDTANSSHTLSDRKARSKQKQESSDTFDEVINRMSHEQNQMEMTSVHRPKKEVKTKQFKDQRKEVCRIYQPRDPRMAAKQKQEYPLPSNGPDNKRKAFDSGGNSNANKKSDPSITMAVQVVENRKQFYQTEACGSVC